MRRVSGVFLIVVLPLVNCRPEDEDVLIIQPPQIQAQSRKEKHRRRHKEGRKKGKEDKYTDDAVHASRKTERSSGTDISHFKLAEMRQNV
jgi:hypothetical protein